MTTTMPYTEKQERLARYAKALGHPARLFILEFLESQSCRFVGNIVDELPMAQSTVSQHLKELKDARWFPSFPIRCADGCATA